MTRTIFGTKLNVISWIDVAAWIIPIINPEIAAPLVIQGNQTNPNKTIKNWKHKLTYARGRNV